MSAWTALLWGALASSSLFIGYALAGPLAGSPKAVALLMGFGTGTLVCAVGYQLVPEAGFKHGPGVGISFLLGALTYYAADLMVDRRGGADRQRLDAQQDPGSPWAMFIGALLDGLPESFVLGITLALGGAVDAAFLAAVFVSNITQGAAGTASLRAAGAKNDRVLWAWTLLTAASAVMAAAGFVLADNVGHEGLWAEAFAGGAVLTMLADSMMPEAFQHGGRAVGLAMSSATSWPACLPSRSDRRRAGRRYGTSGPASTSSATIRHSSRSAWFEKRRTPGPFARTPFLVRGARWTARVRRLKLRRASGWSV